MNAALLYKPNRHWQTWAAFATAGLIHLGAVALAERQPRSVERMAMTDRPFDIDVIATAEERQPPEVADPPELPPLVPTPDSVIPEENPTPPPVRSNVNRPAPRLVRAATAPGATTMHSAKVLAVSAPRPEYPYEARRQRATGSGVVLLTIDPATGYVTNARMSRSTGNLVLDNATVSAFRRWRFKAGTVSVVQAPITFTLTGAAY